MLRKIVACAVALLLGGCATGAADKDLQFNSGSGKALVVLGLEGLETWRGMTVGVSFHGVDANGALDKRDFYVSNGNGWLAMQPVEYMVVEVDPGSYIANATMTHTGMVMVTALYCKGTVKFNAPAGQAVYIGNFAAPPLGARSILPAAPHFDAAAAKLAEFPNVKQTLTQVAVTPTPYPASDQCNSGQ